MRGNRRVLSQVVEQQRSPTRDGGCDEDSPVGYRFNHTSAAAIIAPAPVSGAVGLPAGDLVPYYASALPTVAAKGHPVNVEENYSALVDTVFNADPDSWGGAYVDGDELMVKVVDLAADDAVATLRSAGIRDGVRVAPFYSFDRRAQGPPGPDRRSRASRCRERWPAVRIINRRGRYHEGRPCPAGRALPDRRGSCCGLCDDTAHSCLQPLLRSFAVSRRGPDRPDRHPDRIRDRVLERICMERTYG